MYAPWRDETQGLYLEALELGKALKLQPFMSNDINISRSFASPVID